MEAEFVNVFIQKQRDTINELMARCIMLEVKLSIAEGATTRVVELEQQIAIVRAECELKISQQVKETEALALNLRNEIANLTAANQKLTNDFVKREEELNTLALAKKDMEEKLADAQKKSEEEVARLRKNFNELTLDRERLKNKVDTLKKAL